MVQPVRMPHSLRSRRTGAIMADHIIKNESGGTGMMGWLRPTCSCGWVGGKRHAYEDYQCTMVRDEAACHVHRANAAQQKEQAK